MEASKKLTPEILERIEKALGNRPLPGMDYRKWAPAPPRR
jgi:hypothetical protein